MDAQSLLDRASLSLAEAGELLELNLPVGEVATVLRRAAAELLMAADALEAGHGLMGRTTLGEA